MGISPTGHAGLRTLTPGQCLISVDHEVLVVSDTDVWLDMLYVRLVIPRNFTFFEFVHVHGTGDIITGPNAAAYMTNVTLQGNGDKSPDCVDCGVSVAFNAAVYAEGMTPPSSTFSNAMLAPKRFWDHPQSVAGM